MKKILYFLPLLFLSAWLQAQTVTFPLVLKSGDTIKYVALHKDTVTPPPPTPGYSSTLRYALARNAYKFNLNSFSVGQAVTSLPAQKGVPMPYSSHTQAVLGYPYFTKEGGIVFENTADNGFSAQISSTPATREVWMVLVNPNYSLYEGYCNFFDGAYFGQLGGIGLRVQSGSTLPTSQWQYPTYNVPINKYLIVRYQVLSTPVPNSGNPQVQVSINGSYVSGDASIKLATPIKSYRIGLGTDGDVSGGVPQGANCALMEVFEYIDMPPLTTAQANAVYAEFAAAYPPANTFGPVATNMSFSFTGTTTTVNYTYSGTYPEDVSKRIIRWVNSTNPTVATFLPQYNNMQTIPISMTGGAAGRCEVIVYDTQGNSFTLP